jgi:hypothetical protein
MKDGRTQGDRTQPGGGDGVQQAWQHDEDDRIAAGGAGRIAVMEQQDVAPVQPLQEPGGHRYGIAVAGIEAAAGPAHQAQVEATQDRIEQEVAQACGGTEELGADPGDPGQSFLSGLDLARKAAESEQCEVAAVMQAMVFHGVATRDDFSAQIGVVRRPLADAEEGGFRTIPVEEVEDGGCDRRRRAVIDGDGDLLSRRGCERGCERQALQVRSQ